MAALGANYVTLLDHAKSMEPNGKIAKIAELLKDTNEILEDMPWLPTNGPTSHQHSIRTGMPTGTFRAINEGVAVEKGTQIQVEDGCGILEGWNDIDKDNAEIMGNAEDFRLSQDRAFIIGMNKTMASTIFYGNALTEPKKFTGFSPRFNSSTAENGGNIIKAGGSGSDNTSIWLVVWGPDTVFGLFPNGSKAGLQHDDLGLQTVTDSNNKKLLAYQSRFQWKAGLAVKDWRYICRACNIDVSDLTKNAASGADLIDIMADMLERVEDLVMGRPVFYANRKVKSFLRRQISNKSNVNLSLENAGGKHVLHFDGVPVRLCEAITNAEAAVS